MGIFLVVVGGDVYILGGGGLWWAVAWFIKAHLILSF